MPPTDNSGGILAFLMEEEDEFSDEEIEPNSSDPNDLDSILTEKMSNNELKDTEYTFFASEEYFSNYCASFEGKSYMGTPIVHLGSKLKWIQTFLDERLRINLSKYSKDVQDKISSGKMDGINAIKHSERYRTVLSQYFRFVSDAIHGMEWNLEFHKSFDKIQKKMSPNQIFVNLNGLVVEQLFDKAIVMKFYDFMRVSRLSFNSQYNHSMCHRRILAHIRVNAIDSEDIIKINGLIDLCLLYLKDLARSARIGRAGQSKSSQWERINRGEGLDWKELSCLSEWLMQKLIPFTELVDQMDTIEVEQFQELLITFTALELWGMRRQIIARLSLTSLIKDPNGPNTGFALTKIHEKKPRNSLDYIPISTTLGFALAFWLEGSVRK
jgi:hypothetical protein